MPLTPEQVTEYFELRGEDVYWKKEPPLRELGRTYPYVGRQVTVSTFTCGKTGRLYYSAQHSALIPAAKQSLLHRLKWCIAHGKWPRRLWFADGDSTNTALDNLTTAPPKH